MNVLACWLRSQGFGFRSYGFECMGFGRPAFPGRSKRSRRAAEKAERRAFERGTGVPIHNSLKGTKNHGINRF